MSQVHTCMTYMAYPLVDVKIDMCGRRNSLVILARAMIIESVQADLKEELSLRQPLNFASFEICCVLALLMLCPAPCDGKQILRGSSYSY